MSQAKRVSIKQFFVNKVSTFEQKQKIVKQIKKIKKQSVFDDRLEIATSSLNIQSKVNDGNQNTQRIFQMIDKSIQNKKDIAQLLGKDIEKIQENDTKKEEGKKHLQQQIQKQKPKLKPKFRAKIFKQQLISSLPLETPTSLARWTYGQGVTTSKLVIGNWNVNGIRSILSKKLLYPYIYDHKPDIICITQTKMDEKGFNLAPISLEGYRGYWNFPKHASGYSGVVVFSKYLPKSATEDFLQRQHSQQGRVLTLQFQRFTLINIYVPTVGKDLQRIQYRKKYDSAFRDHVQRLRTANPNKPLFIVGDLNVAHSELDTHPGKQIMLTPSFTNIERQGMTELLALGFSDVYRTLHPQARAYTWWYVNIGGRDRLDTPGLGRRIDYFLVPKQNMKGVKRCDILREYYGADHCPLEMEIDLDLMQT